MLVYSLFRFASSGSNDFSLIAYLVEASVKDEKYQVSHSLWAQELHVLKMPFLLVLNKSS